MVLIFLLSEFSSNKKKFSFSFSSIMFDRAPLIRPTNSTCTLYARIKTLYYFMLTDKYGLDDFQKEHSDYPELMRMIELTVGYNNLVHCLGNIRSTTKVEKEWKVDLFSMYMNAIVKLW